METAVVLVLARPGTAGALAATQPGSKHRRANRIVGREDWTAGPRVKRPPRGRDRLRRGGATLGRLATADADLPSLSYGHLVGDSAGPARRG
jgi:hypothetical protein